MSKQKNTDLSKTETEVAENLSEQLELDSVAATSEKNTVEETKESVTEIEQPATSVTKINKVSTAAVKSNKRMVLSKFLLYYPQDPYIEALLKWAYPKSIFTVEVWFEKIDELLNRPINS